jgi:methionyl-tRNA formyltransferase
MLAAMRMVFFGSPEFALPSLLRLLESEHDVVAVVTQPDRKGGRGQRLRPSPVKAVAIERDVPVHQPASVSAKQSVALLRELHADIGVLAAYGQILRQPVLDAFPLGILNVHASLLPRWRGAAPVPAAILAGDRESGATIMKIVLELDAGPVLDSVVVPIAPDDTAGTLTQKIADAGAECLMQVLPRYAAGELTPKPQDDAQATYAPTIKRTDALIRWADEGAEAIARKVRAYNPWPMAYSYLGGQPLRIVEAIALEHSYDAAPGTIFAFTGVGETPLAGAGFGVTTRECDLGVVKVQPASGKIMSAAAYLNGHREIVGRRLTESPGGS